MRCPLSELSEFLSDAKRFVRYNRHIIEQAPLQSYSSALLFSPRRSIVRRKNYSLRNDPKILAYITNQPETPLQWSASLQLLEGHAVYVNQVVFSHDGKFLVSATSEDCFIIWDAETGGMLERVKTRHFWRSGIAISKQGLLAVLSEGKAIGLWNMKDRRPLPPLDSHANADFLVLSPNGTILVSSDCFSWTGRNMKPNDKITIKLWDITKGTHLRTIHNMFRFPPLLQKILFSPSGKFLVAGNRCGFMRIWRVEDGEIHCDLQHRTEYLGDIIFLADDNMLVSSSKEGMNIWSLEKRSLWKYLGDQSLDAIAMASLPGSKRVASSHGENKDSTIKIWNVNATDERDLLQRCIWAHKDTIKQLVVSGNGKMLASRSHDRTVKIWNADTGDLHNTLVGDASLCDIAFSPNSRVIASAGKEVRLWDAEVCSNTPPPLDTRNIVSSIALSPDGTMIAACLRETIQIWDVCRELPQRSLPGHEHLVTTLSFSSDSLMLASISREAVKIWVLGNNTPPKVIPRRNDGWPSGSVNFSPDGRYVAYCIPNTHTILLDVNSGDIAMKLGKLSGPHDYGSDFAFSLKNITRELLAVASSHEKKVFIWDIADGRRIKILDLPARAFGVAFSPVRNALLVAGQGGGVQVWDALTFTELDAFSLPEQIEKLAFCTNGCCVLSSRGLFSPGKDALENSSMCSDGHIPVFYSRGWLLWRGRRFLWLPPEYRPQIWAGMAIHKETVAIWQESGRIFFLKFNSKRVAKILG